MNVVLLLMHQFWKGADTLFLLNYFSATLIFNWRWAIAKVLFRKTSGIHTCCLENSFVKVSFLFDVSWKLIRWNEINLLSSKIQIRGFNAVCMLLEYLFCFKITDQMKYWINESLITLDIEQWILILKSNVSLEHIKCFKVFYCG